MEATAAVAAALTSGVGELVGNTGVVAGIAIPLALVIFGVPLLVRFGKRLAR
jgi:hypothetical protein